MNINSVEAKKLIDHLKPKAIQILSTAFRAPLLLLMGCGYVVDSTGRRHNVDDQEEFHLISTPEVIRVEDDSLVRESLRQAGRTLVDAGKDWEAMLVQAKELKSGVRGLLPWNQKKAEELVEDVYEDMKHPEIIKTAETFDDERYTLYKWF